MTNLHGELSRRQAELDQLNDQREAVLVELRRLDGRRTQLQQDRMELVDRPRATARRTGERANGSAVRLMSSLSQLHENWGNLSRTAHAPPLPTLSADFTATADLDVGDEQLSAEFAHLGARLEVATSSAAEVLAAARVAVQVADRNAQEQLAAAGATTSDDLAEQLSEARHELRHAIARRQRATAQVPLAEGLDIGLSELTFQLKVLRQVKDLLSPSNFPQFVVQQRQVALLRIASSLFGQLTRAGYGFGEDFMIVDRRTGQPRHPKTLSGGETFLASLALALALVEISNRSGGQLDCLFLDEGFGSLDSAILGEALDVLRLQATGGRLVGVISHLHAVAAELDDVLVVTKEVEGSSFRWLDPQERDAYLLDEAAAGLLS
mgnify:CR=1 FL=1